MLIKIQDNLSVHLESLESRRRPSVDRLKSFNFKMRIWDTYQIVLSGNNPFKICENPSAGIQSMRSQTGSTNLERKIENQMNLQLNKFKET